MMLPNPDHPNIVLSFSYRGFKIQIDYSQFEGADLYAAWADYETGCAMAVPAALTREIAVKRAKQWVDRRLKQT